jgi:transposase
MGQVPAADAVEDEGSKGEAIAKGKSSLSRSTIYGYMADYDLWIRSGKYYTPLPSENPETGKKESKSYARRLVERLERYRDEVCLFLTKFVVPFDNNQAERDLRPVKTKMKVSGVMRTERGAKAYAIIRSFLSTAKKHGVNIMVALRLAFAGRAREAIWGETY